MPDKTIACEDCKEPFTHSEGAQQFFFEKNGRRGVNRELLVRAGSRNESMPRNSTQHQVFPTHFAPETKQSAARADYLSNYQSRCAYAGNTKSDLRRGLQYSLRDVGRS